MAIRGLENIKDKVKGTVKKDDKVIVEIGTYLDENDIGRKLHPDYPHRFKSIIGDLYALGNGMRFLTYKKFKLNWLNRALTKEEFMMLKKSQGRTITKYWDLVKLLLTDRLLSDRKLLQVLNEKFESFDNVRFLPKLILKKGIIEKKVVNDKLYIYGILVTKLVRKIITDFREAGINNIAEADIEKVKEVKLKIKKDIWQETIEKIGDVRLAEGLSDATNEQIEKLFIR